MSLFPVPPLVHNINTTYNLQKYYPKGLDHLKLKKSREAGSGKQTYYSHQHVGEFCGLNTNSSVNPLGYSVFLKNQ